jgi:CheY-like chemotaxis protein
MPSAGTITISTSNVQESGVNGLSMDYVELAIADTGIGMSSEVLTRAFEPFFTTKDVGKGSGLGLPQVYGFAQQSGGRVSIKSETGMGTIVTLLLPRSMRQPATSKAVTASDTTSVKSDAARGGQLLLVEDDDEVAALTRELLSSLGFAVIHVTSAAAALGALANRRSIDVVFSDVMMPGEMSGLDLAQEIRRRQPSLPIVLTTGYVEAVPSMGNEEFKLLLKPYTLEALADALGVEAK